jgi:hypothetical protein
VKPAQAGYDRFLGLIDDIKQGPQEDNNDNADKDQHRRRRGKPFRQHWRGSVPHGMPPLICSGGRFALKRIFKHPPALTLPVWDRYVKEKSGQQGRCNYFQILEKQSKMENF